MSHVKIAMKEVIVFHVIKMKDIIPKKLMMKKILILLNVLKTLKDIIFIKIHIIKNVMKNANIAQMKEKINAQNVYPNMNLEMISQMITNVTKNVYIIIIMILIITICVLLTLIVLMV